MTKVVPAALVAALFLLACGASPEDGDLIEADVDGDGRTERVAPAEALQLAPIDTSLWTELRGIEEQTGGRLGIAAIHVETGWRTVWRGDETFPMASVAKLPMALALMRLVDSGAVRLDSMVRMGPEHHQPGQSLLYHRARRDSLGVSIHSLVEAALTMSDNTACDRLLGIAGGPEAADRLMKRLGLDDIDVSSYEGELILRWAGVDPDSQPAGWTRSQMYEQMQAVGRAAYERAEATLVNDSTDAARPESLARLLVLLQRRQILSPAMTDTVIAMMQRSRTGKGRIPGRLDTTWAVAHKTGSISSVANDVGIVTLPDGSHIAIVALIKGARVGGGARNRAIAEAARLIVSQISSGP